jgi:DNA-nicking Smr family endonuclease
VTKKILSAEDSFLFRETVGKVRSVKNDKAHLTGRTPPRPFLKKPSVPAAEAHVMGLSAADMPAAVGAEDTLDFVGHATPKNVLIKLRQGAFRPEAEIDLHGLSSHEAKRQLQGFLHDCVKAGCHCIHIVHGKGYRSQDQQPVLKNTINLWLRQHHDVRAFCSALPKDGGTGAVYVLLYVS